MRKVVPRLCSLKEQIPAHQWYALKECPCAWLKTEWERPICCQASCPGLSWFPSPKTSVLPHPQSVDPAPIGSWCSTEQGKRNRLQFTLLQGEESHPWKPGPGFFLHLSQRVEPFGIFLAIDLWPRPGTKGKFYIHPSVRHFQVSVKEGSCCHIFIFSWLFYGQAPPGRIMLGLASAKSCSLQFLKTGILFWWALKIQMVFLRLLMVATLSGV